MSGSSLPLNQIVLGDSLEVLMGWPDGCVDAVVTDPPYGWKFMSRKWDYDVPSVDLWQEVMRVMKPGAHLLSFCGTRTYHRMAVNIEDAGFEVRDVISWVYGSGFPKSLDISKALDKVEGAEREVVGREKNWGASKATDGKVAYGDYAGRWDITAPATESAKQWKGWGTALKPAMEMICLARKPLIGTVAENVLAHGTGGLNVDTCRIMVDPEADVSQLRQMKRSQKTKENSWGMNRNGEDTPQVVSPQGRFPANLIHDGSDEVLALFPESGGSGKARKLKRGVKPNQNSWGMNKHCADEAELQDAGTGSAARFFYTAKASPSERGEGNSHPTVKPIDLMKYLIRLVTPPGGIVLDPFGGSGTTAIAAHQLGKQWVLIERDADYHAMAQARIKRECAQLNMFHVLREKARG